ncbi:MAG: cell division protein FtsZ, partial [Polaribacter sp.]|nr:cell division protein FtsZ [Polaribacter sp.]
MNADFDNIEFVMPKTQSSTIKVIGVGGGGSNAVNHMYKEQILGVDFVICNTDAQALENSPIPNKIQLGASLTSGLGAGANPEIGEKAAKESMQEIQQMLNTQTKMVFITAGMGGGTGTGAAPIIAKIAKDMNILTVGIVTMPFQFEGKMRSQQAQLGIAELRKNVDSLIVINNNKLREVYGNLGFKAGFSKADEVLSTAAKGIAEVITHHYKQNIDLHDAKTVLSNSGTAIMGSAKESGQNRAKNAIVKALDSPLLNDNKITGAKNVLLLIVSGANEVTIDEIGEINDFIQTEAGFDANIIMGIGEDDTLSDAISVTVVATGFAADQQNSITNAEDKKIIHSLEDEQKLTYDFNQKQGVEKMSDLLDETSSTKTIVHTLDVDDEIDTNASINLIKTTNTICDIKVEYEEILPNQLKEIEFIINEVSKKEVKTEEEVEESITPLFEIPIKGFEEIKAEKKI